MGRTKIDVRSIQSSKIHMDLAVVNACKANLSIKRVSEGLDIKISRRTNINTRLNNVKKQVSGIVSTMNKISSTVDSCASMYRITEDKVDNQSNDLREKWLLLSLSASYNRFSNLFLENSDKRINLEEKISNSTAFVSSIKENDNKNNDADKVNRFSFLGKETIKSPFVFGAGVAKEYILKSYNDKTSEYFDVLEEKKEASLKSDFKLEKMSEKIESLKEKGEEKLKDKKLFFEEKDTSYYKKKKKIDKKDAPEFYSKEQEIAQISFEKSKSVSVYKGEFNDFFGGNAEVTVGEAEAHGTISAGLYVYGNDNKKVFSPGINGEIGASVTAFNALYENQLLGNENLGLNVDGGVELMSVGAKGELDIGFLGKDKNGNVVFDPQAQVSGELEAVAAELEGSVGVNVLGGEAELKGSLKVGVGVNGSIGYKDGVFKCEVGASLGLGFDVGVSIDVGGAVNTVVEGASQAWDFFF